MICAPGPDCGLCPRLVGFREQNRRKFPDWHNGPVPSFGPVTARLLIVGLAPGLRGANKTGRPFTGDFAGLLLYRTLLKFGFAQGCYGARPDDGLVLLNCRIVNAVRCVPPENKPLPAEIRMCNDFLRSEIANVKPRAILALGAIAHQAVLHAFQLPRSFAAFRHGQEQILPSGAFLVDSFHVSRLNTNTGRLTQDMFEHIMQHLVEMTT